MELIEGLESRASVRGFKSTPVSNETIRKILHAASRCPSYTNSQPWEVAVVTGSKRDELSTILYDLAASGVKSNADVPAPKSWPEDIDTRTKIHGENDSKRWASAETIQFVAMRCVFRISNFSMLRARCSFLWTNRSDHGQPWIWVSSFTA